MFKRRNRKGKKQDPEFSEMSGYDDVDEQGELDDLGGPVEMPRRNGLDRIDEPDEEALPEDDLTDDVIRPIASHRNRENPFRRKTGNIIQVGGDPELREENIAKRTKRRVKKTRLFVIAVVLLIVAGAVYYVYTHVREFQGYKVLLSSDTVYEPNAEYTEFGGNLLKYTPEGVSYIDPNGNVVWTAGADMKVPIASTRGNYAVVADKGGNAVRVFSTEGAVSDLVMPYKILDVDVASQGAHPSTRADIRWPFPFPTTVRSFSPVTSSWKGSRARTTWQPITSARLDRMPMPTEWWAASAWIMSW